MSLAALNLENLRKVEMNDDLMMQVNPQPQRVATRTIANTEYKIRLTRPITDIDDFAEEILALESASPDDIVFLQISSPGGSLETCDFLCRRMEECAAPIVVEIGLTCASAASALMLQADDWIINESSTVMIHACSYSPGWGKEVDVFSSANYTNRINREWLERTYKGFLSEEELKSALDGKDLYFYADDLRERLPKFKEYRQSQPCHCGDPNCGVDSEEDEEPEITLEDIISNAVEKGIQEGLGKILKKYDLTEKPKKTSAKVKPDSVTVVGDFEVNGGIK